MVEKMVLRMAGLTVRREAAERVHPRVVVLVDLMDVHLAGMRAGQRDGW